MNRADPFGGIATPADRLDHTLKKRVERDTGDRRGAIAHRIGEDEASGVNK